ncbi:MAG: hypothetical protein M1361_01330 [Patescibacteria group bacterium]|nr:hypothetical protein [Patescibacteria group bacterium]MCL5224241.1 hypothetical protein [Patescibacteria group bacterium]
MEYVENFIYCTEEEVIDYLKRFGRGKDSRDTELSEAIRFKRLYEKEFKKPFLVGVPVKPEGIRRIRSGKISRIETVKEFREDDTDIDFLIIDAYATPRYGFEGDLFQMKRLTTWQFHDDFNTSIIEELKKIFAKGYMQSPYLTLYLALNLAPQSHASNWQMISRFCTENKVPFLRIIVGPIGNENGEELLVEIFPRLHTVKL